MGERGFDHAGLRNAEEPVHTVVIPHAYYLGKYPVTQEQYQAVASRVVALRDRSDPTHCMGNRYPVGRVNWHEANRFCAALSALVPANQLPKGLGLFCLPTEAEWEHACRAGTDTEYHTGDGEAALREAGWFHVNSRGFPHDVDAAVPNDIPPKPNGFGLHHMHGSLEEWCQDLGDEEAYRRRCDGDVDPGHEARFEEWRGWNATWVRTSLEVPLSDEQLKVTEDDRDRVVRGGSWGSTAWWCRSAFRFWRKPDDRLRHQGFRVCLVPGPAVPPAASANQHEA
jgi:formylglycine-generating enzyme required for sulfatase activity